jgi:hypothetical protein
VSRTLGNARGEQAGVMAALPEGVPQRELLNLGPAERDGIIMNQQNLECHQSAR